MKAKRKLKNVLNAITNLPNWPGTILGLVFVSLSVLVLLLSIEDGLLTWICYILSAYGLCLLVRCGVLPLLRWGKRMLWSNPWINRYYTDHAFNARVSLYRGLILNLCYAVFKLSVGIWTGSVWFIAIAIYYMALSGTKFILVREDLRSRREKQSPLLREWKAYRAAGGLLFPMNVALSGIIILVVDEGNSYAYPGCIIFAMAFYAFYRVGTATVRLLRRRWGRGPVFLAATIIDFVFAVVAIFTLQTAMVSTFDTENTAFATKINLISGIGVSLFIIGVTLYMLIHSGRNIKRICRENDRAGGHSHQG